jgi:hypothetical protein
VTRCHQPGAACRPLAHASQGWGRVACQGRDHRAQRERSAGPRMARASRAPIVSHRRAAVRCAVPVAANSPPRAAMPPGSAADTTRRAQHGERWRTMANDALRRRVGCDAACREWTPPRSQYSLRANHCAASTLPRGLFHEFRAAECGKGALHKASSGSHSQSMWHWPGQPFMCWRFSGPARRTRAGSARWRCCGVALLMPVCGERV